MIVPSVTILINAFNGARFLEQTIESVLRQEWQDWELLLWDDRSTDATAEIFRSRRDPRFRYILAPDHTPLGPARIAAVKHARGAWIAFLDQDDLWTPDKLARQMALACEPAGRRPLGLVYGRAAILHPGNRTSVHDHRHEHGELPEGDIFDRLLVDSCYIGMSTALVRAEAYHAVGGFSESFDYAIDYQFFLALSRRFDARAVQPVCCWYRTHPDSLSQTRRAEVHAEVIRVLGEWEGIADPALLRHRRRVHETLLAYEQARLGQVWQGLARLVRRGSISYLASRPFVRAGRSVRRLFRPSPWAPPAYLEK